MSTETVPNHHHDHPGFSGVSGLVAAIGFSFGRVTDADLAIRLTELRAGEALVDVGCGPGSAVRRAAALGATVTGVDPAAVMLRTARLIPRRGDARFVTGTAEHLPVPDGSAAVAWSLATVHHWSDINAGLHEVQRVLASGGRFLVLERHTYEGATGVASHGWTRPQADTFADRCEQLGFTDVVVAEHDEHRPLLSVLARA